MTAYGIYQKTCENGEVKKMRATFVTTGIKEYGKAIWRKLNKEGKPTNIFAEQFDPNVPWAMGKWFIQISSARILTDYPQLKVETEKSKSMSDEEFIKYLENTQFF